MTQQWVRFRWDLRTAELDVHPPEKFQELSGNLANLVSIVDLVIRAYASEEVWHSQLSAIASRMHQRIRQTLGQSECEYVLVKCGDALAAVSGIATSHWTDQNLLTGICVRPEFQRQGLGKYLLGRSLQRLQSRGLSTAQVYTERGSLADRKIYPLYNSSREENVVYPGAQKVPGDASIVHHNSYFHGHVQSLGFATPTGYATAGVIAPGTYEFTADYEEHVLVISGALRVRLPNAGWVEVPANNTYIVLAGVTFEVQCDADVAYLCRYYPNLPISKEQAEDK